MSIIQSIFSLLILFVLVTGTYAWMFTIVRWWRGEPILAVEPRRPVPWGLFDLLLTVSLYIALVSIGVMILRQFSIVPTGESAGGEPGNWSPNQLAGMLLVNAMANLVMLPLACLLIAVRTHADRRDFGWDFSRVIYDLRIGAVAFTMIAPPVYLIQFLLTQWFPSEHPLMKMVTEQPQPLVFIVAGFSAVIAAPLAEEFLFRVLLQGWLERAAIVGGDLRQIFLGGRIGTTEHQHAVADDSTPGSMQNEKKDIRDGDTADGIRPVTAIEANSDANPYQSPQLGASYSQYGVDQPRRVPMWPMFASAALFAVMHAGHGPDPIPLFFLALGLGLLYQRTHRILPCITVHLLLNTSSMAALIVGVLSEPA